MIPIKKFRYSLAVLLALFSAAATKTHAQFDIQLTISNPAAFTPTELNIIEEAIVAAEELWESQIVGYQAEEQLGTVLPINVVGTTTGLGSAQGFGQTTVGGFTVFTSGQININRLALEEFADFEGSGTNFVDELVAHEIAHVLGIGPLWVANGVYENGTGQYTGEFGVAAFQEEFNQTTDFIPVELAGPPGSADNHWDQFFRSAEGPPGVDPFTLSPLTGIVDDQGRDLGQELLTAAIDPDFGEPFLSNFTVQSLRDIGFVVASATAVPEPSAVLLAIAGGVVLPVRRRCVA